LRSGPAAHHEQARSHFDAAVDLPLNKQGVLIEKGLASLKAERREGNIDAASGERQLDRAGRIAELPATALKGVQVPIAPAKGDLQRRMQLGERALFRG
jgi:hypothetical protein